MTKKIKKKCSCLLVLAKKFQNFITEKVSECVIIGSTLWACDDHHMFLDTLR